MARTAVVAGTATAVSGRVARRQQRRWQEEAEPEQAMPAPSPAASGGSSQNAPGSAIDQLERFGNLYQQGLLTEDEFEAQKAKLLAS